MKHWKKILIVAGTLSIVVFISTHFARKDSSTKVPTRSSVQFESANQIMPKDSHHHTLQEKTTHEEHGNNKTVSSNQTPLSNAVMKAKKNIQQTLLGDMQVKVTPISLHQWRDHNKVINVEKVLIEVSSKNNKISSSYYAMINAKNGKVIRTFGAPIFENKDLIGKNIFYIK
jgi:hypothetical protein